MRPWRASKRPALVKGAWGDVYLLRVALLLWTEPLNQVWMERRQERSLRAVEGQGEEPLKQCHPGVMVTLGRPGWLKSGEGKQKSASKKWERNDEHNLFFHYFSTGLGEASVMATVWRNGSPWSHLLRKDMGSWQHDWLLLSSQDAKLIALLSTFIGGQLVVKSLSKTKAGLERWLRAEEHLLLLQRVHFPEPSWSHSQVW